MNLYQIPVLCSIFVTVSPLQSYNWNEHFRMQIESEKHHKRHNRNSAVSSQPSSDTQQRHRTCSDLFLQHIHRCTDTFTPNIDTYLKTKPKDPFVQNIFRQHICRSYEKMLLCIHVVLTNCKTSGNTETVQQNLGQPWVIEINKMCHINSNSTRKTQSEKNHGGQKQLTKMNDDLKNSALFNKLMHSSDTDGEIITMFVFRSALKAPQQTGSLPNSLHGSDKLQQKYQSSNLLHLLISLCRRSNDANSLKYNFLAQSENSAARNGIERIFCWQVVVLITLTYYLYCIIT